MDIIDSSQYLTGKRQGRSKPTINLTVKNIALTKASVTLLSKLGKHHEYTHNGKPTLYLLFAFDGDQLCVTLTGPGDNRGLRFVQSSSSTYQACNKGLIQYLGKKTNRTEEKFKFLISDAANEEGWFPVITNYKG